MWSLGHRGRSFPGEQVSAEGVLGAIAILPGENREEGGFALGVPAGSTLLGMAGSRSPTRHSNWKLCGRGFLSHKSTLPPASDSHLRLRAVGVWGENLGGEPLGGRCQGREAGAPTGA